MTHAPLLICSVQLAAVSWVKDGSEADDEDEVGAADEHRVAHNEMTMMTSDSLIEANMAGGLRLR
jgi:hypothetical protein